MLQAFYNTVLHVFTVVLSVKCLIRHQTSGLTTGKQ